MCSQKKYYLMLTIIFSLLLTPSPIKADKNLNVQNKPSNAFSSPRRLISHFNSVLLGVMKNAKKLGIQGRYNILLPEVLAAFDLKRWIRISSGRYWHKSSYNQKKKLKKVFKEISAATYASQFKSYNGEEFRIIDLAPGPQKTVLVKTEIIRKNNKPVSITYIVIKIRDKWKIVDILLENKISQLSVRRSEYQSYLKKNGIDGLILKIKKTSKSILAR